MTVKNRAGVITICGSTKFADDYLRAAQELTLAGNIVLSCPILSQSRDKEWWDKLSDEEKTHNIELLREIHNQRIDMCDAIFVVNPNGYIGESTREEIEYARKANKGIMYMYGSDGCVFDHNNSTAYTNQ